MIETESYSFDLKIERFIKKYARTEKKKINKKRRLLSVLKRFNVFYRLRKSIRRSWPRKVPRNVDPVVLFIDAKDILKRIPHNWHQRACNKHVMKTRSKGLNSQQKSSPWVQCELCDPLSPDACVLGGRLFFADAPEDSGGCSNLNNWNCILVKRRKMCTVLLTGPNEGLRAIIHDYTGARVE